MIPGAAYIGAAAIIGGLFFWTIHQAETIGELKAEVSTQKALAEYKEKTQAASQAINEAAAAKVDAAETQLQETINERETFRRIADQKSQESPADFGDDFSDGLAVWMRCIAADNRQTCRIYPASADEASPAN